MSVMGPQGTRACHRRDRQIQSGTRSSPSRDRTCPCCCTRCSCCEQSRWRRGSLPTPFLRGTGEANSPVRQTRRSTNKRPNSQHSPCSSTRPARCIHSGTKPTAARRAPSCSCVPMVRSLAAVPQAVRASRSPRRTTESYESTVRWGGLNGATSQYYSTLFCPSIGISSLRRGCPLLAAPPLCCVRSFLILLNCLLVLGLGLGCTQFMVFVAAAKVDHAIECLILDCETQLPIPESFSRAGY